MSEVVIRACWFLWGGKGNVLHCLGVVHVLLGVRI